MLTLLLYLLVMVAVVALVFTVAWFVFGRGEELPPTPRGTTLTRLPRAGITGADVRSVRLAVVLRGYKQSEVDWVLEKLAREIDELRTVVGDLQGRDANDFSLPEKDGTQPEVR
ncbi:DivIVA domain-containing protein [Williamsia sp. CHRR-6]|uniref:DivIVA domain-containing protein n=1 Tax=Williamsia sp. CHRR-6 TaxID=2835871 RepID=UPI001BDA15F2|nr:DivIVA domain-containing protein [Williamsia sp. CHRR-6]MBT0565513.1 DivIVA domain-containing protein [Williamsia sp. CHRR-6]